MFDFSPRRATKGPSQTDKYNYLFLALIFLVTVVVIWTSITSKEVVGKVTIVSPNGGEKWTGGEEYAIQWQSQDVAGVDIYVTNMKGDVMEVAKGVDATLGEYLWPVPNDFNLNQSAAADLVLIQMNDVDNPDVRDLSDKYFTIKEGALVLKDMRVPISWMDNKVLFKIQEVTMGNFKAKSSLKRTEGGFYEDGEQVYVLILSLNIKNINQEPIEVPVNVRVFNEETKESFDPNLGFYKFVDKGINEAEPQIEYPDQRLFFVLPEGTREVLMEASERPRIRFKIWITEDNELKMKRVI